MRFIPLAIVAVVWLAGWLVSCAHGYVEHTRRHRSTQPTKGKP